MRMKQGKRVWIALGGMVCSQSAWAIGPVPGIAIAPLIAGIQGGLSPQTKTVLLTADPNKTSITSANVAPVRYKIRAGDSLEIKIMGRPELTQAMTVAPDGTIVYPYVGEVVVAGETITQIINKLKIGLRRQFENPQPLVSVLKRQMGEVSVLGPVKEPGKKELGDEWHVLNLIAASGGLTVERPEFVKIKLVRKGGQLTYTVDPVQLFASNDPTQNLVLEDGDLLVIQERDKSETMVQVVGEVSKPGFVVNPQDGSPLAALAAAGGGSSKAALSKATVRRGVGGAPIPVDLSNPATLTNHLQLLPGDTLVIPASMSQVSILGAGVVKPGVVELPDSIQPTIYWAIQQVGGVNQGADLKSATITRLAPNGTPVTAKIDLEKIFKNQTSQGRDAEEVRKLNNLLKVGDVLEILVKGTRSRGFRLGMNEMMMSLSTFLMIREVAK